MMKTVWLDFVEASERAIDNFVNKAVGYEEEVFYEVKEDGINGYAMVRFHTNEKWMIENLEAYYDYLAN